jgi:WhiB family transcriptional regulator, redox-sensing transcriptional regulator
MTVNGWMSQGACRGEDPGLFFPVAEIGPSLREVEQARAVCRRCPVLAACLRYALDTRQEGIWGATTDGERRAIRRAARRDRARRAMAGAGS